MTLFMEKLVYKKLKERTSGIGSLQPPAFFLLSILLIGNKFVKLR